MKSSSFRRPWWLTLGAKLILSRLPLRHSFWNKLGLFRHGAMETPEYAIRVFAAHMQMSGLTENLRGKLILELGPGDSIASAVIAKTYGARAILVDASPIVRSDIRPYRVLTDALTLLGQKPPVITDCQTIDDVLARCDARYLSAGLVSLQEIESESVDLVFSQAVLEHVHNQEFFQTMKECYRILKPNGISTHQVDLRDHLGGALNNLRFSETVWDSYIFKNSGFYTNRIQFNAMQQLFADAGFLMRDREVCRWTTLPTKREKMNKKFSVLPEDELCIATFDVVLQKPSMNGKSPVSTNHNALQ